MSYKKLPKTLLQMPCLYLPSAPPKRVMASPPQPSHLPSLVDPNPASGSEEGRGLRETQVSALKKRSYKGFEADSKLTTDNPAQG